MEIIQTTFSPIKAKIRSERLSPIIKWAGGKEGELKYILPNIPEKFDRYFEPFVGGGAVYFAIDCDEMLINDKSTELVALYRLIQEDNNDFFGKLFEINRHWRLLEQIVENNAETLTTLYKNSSPVDIASLQIKDWVTEFVLHHVDDFHDILRTTFNIDLDNFIHELIRNLSSKLDRMRKIEREKGQLPQPDVLNNIEGAFKSAFYMHFRHLYNKSKVFEINEAFATAIFYFVREFCYASMFRYNKHGGFNVPYGGIQYNRKDFYKKISVMRSTPYQNHLGKTKIFCRDFEAFLNEQHPTENDFIFIDPPYDSDFSTYTKNAFDRDDQIRLANYLFQCRAKFMIVIKNTEFIGNLYANNDLRIEAFDKKYTVSFQNRNDKNAEHLIIMNY